MEFFCTTGLREGCCDVSLVLKGKPTTPEKEETAAQEWADGCQGPLGTIRPACPSDPPRVTRAKTTAERSVGEWGPGEEE